ncbi:MAG: hypothetical protein M1291_05570 [Thaumarchaeota archaeon]|jgi:ubiquinone/menaquinone biosynthesis C-methylase UbiE|nr:hypothetical protein [Nitrososphaerota archaeon]
MPSPADKELKSVYNEIASSYDRANSFISFYQDGRLRKELVKMLVSIKTPAGHWTWVQEMGSYPER